MGTYDRPRKRVTDGRQLAVVCVDAKDQGGPRRRAPHGEDQRMPRDNADWRLDTAHRPAFHRLRRSRPALGPSDQPELRFDFQPEPHLLL
jgi:hypothetical protein